jgi:hypothetical protein
MVDENQQFHWGEGLKFATEGIKGFFLLNGAAAISILTFIGNANNGDDKLVYAMFCFALGALIGPVSFLFAYLTQLQYGNQNFTSALRYHNVTYASIILGMLFFLAGVVLAGYSFIQISPDIAG